VVEMARGASFLRSLPGVVKQDDHTDFDFQDYLPPQSDQRGRAGEHTTCSELEGRNKLGTITPLSSFF
jgi:hypothetical protein